MIKYISSILTVDTYWQTESGGHIITPLPGATPMKPGSAVRGTNTIEGLDNLM